MKELKGTKTEENLRAAFRGEVEASVKYAIFAGAAKRDGFVDVSNFFTQTSGYEKEHAKAWLKLLGGVGDTKANLQSAIKGEHFEWTDMYREFARVAHEEGFSEIAKRFELTGAIEKHHEASFQAYLDKIAAGEFFKSSESVTWECQNCSHRHVGTGAPEICPVCKHPQSFFKILK